jgi:hypothetical protein
VIKVPFLSPIPPVVVKLIKEIVPIVVVIGLKAATIQ